MYTTKLLSSSIGDNLASFEGIASNGVFENESVLTVFQRSSRMFGIFGRPVPGLSSASEVETRLRRYLEVPEEGSFEFGLN